MPKINKEEYEVLKALDSRAKSIARQARGWLWVAEQPIMKDEIGWYVEDGFDAVLEDEDDNLFHFIQWEDREPYNIAELIKEYEYSNEPEVLSQEWIDEHRKSYTMEDSVEISELQNLLVPKQKEVKRAQIPEWIIEWYQGANNEFSVLEDVFSNLSHDTGYNIMDSEKFRSRIMKYGGFPKMYEALSHIYFGVYEIEEEEQMYYAKLKEIKPPENEWLTNLSGPNYYALDTKGLMLGEFILDLVGIKTEASTHTLKDWERYGINDSNADFVKVDE